jgi:hypothetical protein
MDLQEKIKDLTDPVLVEEYWQDYKDKVIDVKDEDRPERVFSVKFSFGNK